jgi:hypothetical protein
MSVRAVLGMFARFVIWAIDCRQPIRVTTFEGLAKEARYGNVLYLWDSVEGGVSYTNFRLVRPALRAVVLKIPRDQARSPFTYARIQQASSYLNLQIRSTEPRKRSWWR